MERNLRVFLFCLKHKTNKVIVLLKTLLQILQLLMPIIAINECDCFIRVIRRNESESGKHTREFLVLKKFNYLLGKFNNPVQFLCIIKNEILLGNIVHKELLAKILNQRFHLRDGTIIDKLDGVLCHHKIHSPAIIASE